MKKYEFLCHYSNSYAFYESFHGTQQRTTLNRLRIDDPLLLLQFVWSSVCASISINLSLIFSQLGLRKFPTPNSRRFEARRAHNLFFSLMHFKLK